MKHSVYHFQTIGVIHSPHQKGKETPIQPVFAKGVRGSVEIDPEYQAGLNDLEGFSHIYLLYYFNQSDHTHLRTIPYLDSIERGVFATRSPHRPNKIGMSLVRLLKVQNSVLTIGDVDILDNTPLLDIKPYIQRYDSRPNARSGWQEDISDVAAQSLGKREYGKKNIDRS